MSITGVTQVGNLSCCVDLRNDAVTELGGLLEIVECRECRELRSAPMIFIFREDAK